MSFLLILQIETALIENILFYIYIYIYIYININKKKRKKDQSISQDKQIKEKLA